MDVKTELERLKAQAYEELKDEPTREQKEEAIKWLGYEWDSILKFLRYLDRDTSVDVPDEVRIAYQQGLYQAKLEAVKAKQAATDSGLIRAIRQSYPLRRVLLTTIRTQNCAICTINCIYYTVFRIKLKGDVMKRTKTAQPRTKTIKQRTSMKYTGNKNVAAAMAVNHNGKPVTVPRRTK